MTAKELKKQLRKLKKTWPHNLRPRFQPNGDIRIIKSLFTEDLNASGVRTFQDLLDNQENFEKSFLSQGDIKIQEELHSLVKKSAASSLSPLISLPIFEEFFPGIWDEIISSPP